MKTLLKSIKIIDPGSTHHHETSDILLDKGLIQEVAEKISVSDNHTIIEHKNLHVSPGLFDMNVNFCDPGFEYKEDIQSGLRAAASGGFTGVLISPATCAPIDNKSSVLYAIQQAEKNICELNVCGSISRNLEGKQLADLFDMHRIGALAFGDGKAPINHTDLMNRALEYVKNFKSVIISFPFDADLNHGGLIHEGKTSVSLGLKGMPSTSEELRLIRDIELLRYTKSKMHVCLISTARSVELVRQAKKDGLDISCGMAAHQLSFLDEDLTGFDTRLKVLPPFRSKIDKQALIAGLSDGTIDVICSDHSPEDIENKKCEFEHAAFGISSVETTFSTALTTLNGKLPLDKLIASMAIHPRKILGLEIPTIEANSEINLTLFVPDENWTVNKDKLLSKSNNTPFGNMTLKGRIKAVARGNKLKRFL